MSKILSDQQKAAAIAKQKAKSRIDENINIETLPAPVRDYIRLQHEITDRDVGQIKVFFNPDTINSFSQAGQKKVQKDRKENSQWWYEFLMMQIKTFSQIFAQTWLRIDTAFKELELMEEQLDSMNDMPFDAASSNLREQINTTKEELNSYKQELINKPEPTANRMQNIQESIDQKMTKLGQYFKGFNSIRKTAQTLVAAGASHAFFSAQNLLQQQVNNIYPNTTVPGQIAPTIIEPTQELESE